MVSAPEGNVVVFMLAVPADSVPVPNAVVPLVKVTLPPGVPAPEATVAVRVTLAPLLAVVGALTVVVVAAPVTVRVPFVKVTV